MKWKLIDKHYLLRCKWLTVRKDHVLLPTGISLDDYYVLEYPTWINVIAITNDGLFVIERQYRHGLSDVYYEICAGNCEEGEKPQDAAMRELLEETGYSGGEWYLYGISAPNPASMNNLCYTYIAYGVSHTTEASPENSEDIEVLLLNGEEVLGLMQDGKIIQGCMLAMLWKLWSENYFIWK